MSLVLVKKKKSKRGVLDDLDCSTIVLLLTVRVCAKWYEALCCALGFRIRDTP